MRYIDKFSCRLIIALIIIISFFQFGLHSKLTEFLPEDNIEVLLEDNTDNEEHERISKNILSEKSFIDENLEEVVLSADKDSILMDNEESKNEEEKKVKDKKYAWNDFLDPWNIFDDEGAVFINFSNADLINVLKYFESIYQVIFITDDVIQPMSSAGKSLLGSKINFTTNNPLSRREAWNVFITLLELAGVTLQPGSMQRTYRVVTLQKDSPMSYTKGPLPVYIGIEGEDLPDSDMRIRYLYQVKNTSLEAVKSIVKTMQSPSSPDPIDIPEIYGIMITDRVYNIKTMISVIKELDKLTMPETLVIIKLIKTDAFKITELYKSLIKDDGSGQNQQPGSRLLGPKRTDTINYFDGSVRVIPDVRTNTLIALGPIHSIKRFESFVKECENRNNEVPYMPIRTYKLQYTQAEAVAKILDQALTFKTNMDFAKVGGVREGDKYFANVSIVAEPTTNTLIISAPQDEYDHIHKLILELDVEQKQVGLDVTIVSVDITKNKQLGTQIRNTQGALGGNFNAQSGLLDPSTGIVADYTQNDDNSISNGANRLLGNLMQLITGSPQSPGSTVITLGTDQKGVWGILKMLQNEAETKIISSPFIVATNKYEAVINVGEVRRIQETSINNDNNTSKSYTSDDAKIQVKITPQISDSGLITLNVYVENSQFEADANKDAISSGNKNTRSLYTSLLVNDNEVAVIGGLVYESVSEVVTEVPFLGKIPLIGWLFKSKSLIKTKKVMLVFIRPKIISSENEDQKEYTESKTKQSKMGYFTNGLESSKCPINRWFFGATKENELSSNYLEEFMLSNNYLGEKND